MRLGPGMPGCRVKFRKTRPERSTFWGARSTGQCGLHDYAETRNWEFLRSHWHHVRRPMVYRLHRPDVAGTETVGAVPGRRVHDIQGIGAVLKKPERVAQLVGRHHAEA